jgi:hypothetical protein
MDLSKGPQIHPIRIRNATGGKNPQNSNHSNGKDNKLTQQKSIKKKQVTPKMQNLSSSTPRTGLELQRKKEEFLMLEQMKIIQKPRANLITISNEYSYMELLRCRRAKFP